MPETTPPSESTVATAALPLDQVPPNVASDSIMDPPTYKVVSPLIGAIVVALVTLAILVVVDVPQAFVAV